MSTSEKMVYEIVVALCNHYDVRARAINEKSISPRVRMEYVYINSKMLDASARVVGDVYAEIFIKEIGERIGYAKSATYLSETVYKARKEEVKISILKEIYYIDADFN